MITFLSIIYFVLLAKILSFNFQQRSDLAGIVVGHAKEDFLEGNETILVLEDKGIIFSLL